MGKAWEPCFPNLGKWDETSHPTRRYNCFAWAAGEDFRRWDVVPGYYWPPGVMRSTAVDFVIEAYRTRGYEICADRSVEPGFDKIVIYAKPGRIGSHAAIQLLDGRWSSKLGDEEDITHETPESLESTIYGKPFCFMSRSRA